MSTVLILLAFYGSTFALKEGTIFDRPRIWLIRQSPVFHDLFSCYACVGFWSGMIVYTIATPFTYGFSLRTMIVYGLASSAFSFLTNLAVDRFLVRQEP